MSGLSDGLLKVKPSETSAGEIDVFAYNDVQLGTFYMEIDGFYVYDAIHRPGFMPSYMLRALADKLDELNEPYEKQMKEYFESEATKRES
jgi:hypothetical protein